MKNIKRLSTASTIICIVSVIIYIVIALYLVLGGFSNSLFGIADSSMDKLNAVDSNSPSAGYEVLAYLAGGLFGIFGGIFVFIFAFFVGMLAIYQIPPIVSGLVANIKNKKEPDIIKSLKIYKIDGFIKVIMSGIFVAGAVLMIAGDIRHTSILDIAFLLLLEWNYIAVFILSILQIKNISTEERSCV